MKTHKQLFTWWSKLGIFFIICFQLLILALQILIVGNLPTKSWYEKVEEFEAKKVELDVHLKWTKLLADILGSHEAIRLFKQKYSKKFENEQQ